MGTELVPRSGQLPDVQEIIRRMRAEFSYVTVDEDDGLKQARERAEWIEQAPARIFLGRRQEALRGAAKLKALSRGEAVTIEFGDGQAVTRRFVAIPGEPLSFGYASEADEKLGQKLIERLALALDCDVERV